jgi:hypothetical protein
LADELGLPIDFRITAGQVHDSTQAIDLLGARKANWVMADKGYDSQTILDHIRAMGSSRRNPLQGQSQTTAQAEQNTLSRTKPHRALFRKAQELPPLCHSI